MLRSVSSPYGITRNGRFTIIKNVVTGTILSADYDPPGKYQQAMVKCLQSWHYDVTSETNVNVVSSDGNKYLFNGNTSYR